MYRVTLWLGTAFIAAGCATTTVPERVDETAASKALVLEFFEKVLLGGDLSLAPEYLREDYIQHNPQIPGGLDGFVTYFTEINATLKQMNATISGEIEHVVAEGDMVCVFVAYKIEGPMEVNFRAADLFRVENGMIAEHWDVRQGATLRDHQILMQN
jgi:predicted SnoaL-like aldol condensation-catalyzing enzyme